MMSYSYDFADAERRRLMVTPFQSHWPMEDRSAGSFVDMQSYHRHDARGCPIARAGRPLPRSKPDSEVSQTQSRRRIAVACARCRKRKIKCSGDAGNGSQCENCRNSGTDNCTFYRVGSGEVAEVRSGTNPTPFYSAPSINGVAMYTNIHSYGFPRTYSGPFPSLNVATTPKSATEWTYDADSPVGEVGSPYSLHPNDTYTGPYTSHENARPTHHMNLVHRPQVSAPNYHSPEALNYHPPVTFTSSGGTRQLLTAPDSSDFHSVATLPSSISPNGDRTLPPVTTYRPQSTVPMTLPGLTQRTSELNIQIGGSVASMSNSYPKQPTSLPYHELGLETHTGPISTATGESLQRNGPRNALNGASDGHENTSLGYVAGNCSPDVSPTTICAPSVVPSMTAPPVTSPVAPSRTPTIKATNTGNGMDDSLQRTDSNSNLSSAGLYSFGSEDTRGSLVNDQPYAPLRSERGIQVETTRHNSLDRLASTLPSNNLNQSS